MMVLDMFFEAVPRMDTVSIIGVYGSPLIGIRYLLIRKRIA